MDNTVGDYAKAMNITPATIIKKCLNLNVMANVNQILEKDIIELICDELGFKLVEDKIDELVSFDEQEVVDDPKDLVKRNPIVTIMGHVDHGKTTLLDTIRKTRVVAKEAGGITQHIGAYQVKRNGSSITFIDTPGHAAFSEMRARGAKVTDIVVLVVAADDGVKPQTIEAIDHALAAGVKIIVAINKIDKPGVNPERVITELSEHNIVSEDWGGNIPFVRISALKNEGIDELLDIIDLVAEMEELKANPNRDASGSVIEARVDKGKGVVATVIVLNGTLNKGDNVVVGNTFGKIRTLTNEMGKPLKKALPSEPVEITGLSDIPKAGDKFITLKDDKTAKQIASKRQDYEREQQLKSRTKTLDDLINDEEQVLNLVIKADVQGSIEALTGLLAKIEVGNFKINVISARIGAISETDLILANASNATLIGFNVRPTSTIRQMAEEKNVDIKLYNVIYQVQEDIENSLKGMLEPETKEVVIGQAEVRELFKVGKTQVAGCFVTYGVIKRDSLIRVLRDGIVVYEGKLESLRRFKDDVKEVKQGYDCGLKIEKFDDLKQLDIIEASEMKEI